MENCSIGTFENCGINRSDIKPLWSLLHESSLLRIIISTIYTDQQQLGSDAEIVHIEQACRMRM